MIDRRLTQSSSYATPEVARALRRTLEDAGGLLVKFGQIASTREDLLPPVLTSELAGLRTAVPALGRFESCNWGGGEFCGSCTRHE